MKDYEWIKTGERLFSEGENQHNCVLTYRASIRKDISAIFYLNRINESYTIRIGKDRKGRFYVAEMRGRFNCYSWKENIANVNSFLWIANRRNEEEVESLEAIEDDAVFSEY